MTETQIGSNTCQNCGKPLKQRRRGSLTAWIFGQGFCECAAHDPHPSIQKRSSKDGVPDGSDNLIGRLVEDRYEVKQLLARGGMGCVYLLEDRSDKKMLAMKTLDPVSVSISSWMRLEKEARAAGKLDHPGILKVYSSGLLDHSLPFFVMEYLDGENLADCIKREGPLPLAQALPIFIKIAFALGYAHEQGVVHRDLKPSNIMLYQEASDAPVSVKIVDFGIAKMVSAEDAESLSLTSTGQVFGTPYYMSPEQCFGGTVDHRSDIYSLGCVMFETLTGHPPFLSETALSLMMKHQTERPPSLREASLGVEFPASIEQVISKMLEKDPARRYPSLSKLVMDLDAIKSGRPLHMQEQPQKPPESRTAVVVIACGALLACLTTCFVAGFWMGGQQPSNTPPKEILYDPQHSIYDVAVKPFCTEELVGDREVRHFRLPPSDNWLRLTVIDSNGNLRLSAGHAMDVRKGARVEAEIDPAGAIWQPAELLGFGPDDLDSLKLSGSMVPPTDSGDVLTDGLMAYVARMRSLHRLDVSGNGVSDKGMFLLQDLPNLDHLNVARTRVTENGLLMLKRLPKLYHLEAGPTTVHRLFNTFATSRNLTSLSLRQCDLDKSDIEEMSKISSLKELWITGGKLSGEQLAPLQKLPHLTYLSVLEVPWHNPAATLREFPALKAIVITKEMIPADEITELKKTDLRVGVVPRVGLSSVDASQ